MNFSINNPKEYARLGLKDCGNRLITCYVCNNCLINFQITKTNEDLVESNINPITTKVLIVCEKCDNGIETLIRGQFYIGAGQENIGFEIDENPKDFDLIIRARLK